LFLSHFETMVFTYGRKCDTRYFVKKLVKKHEDTFANNESIFFEKQRRKVRNTTKSSSILLKMLQWPCRFFLYSFSCGVITDQSIAKGRKMQLTDACRQLTDACYWRGLSGIDRGDYWWLLVTASYLYPPPPSQTDK
jgi:hypothetical protein